MKKILVLVLSAVSICSFAAGNTTYVDANIGVNTSASSLALNADVGYMLNQYLGLEGGLTYSPNGGSWGANGVDYWMFDGAVKGVLPLSNMFALYGKLGIAFNTYSSSCGGCSNSDVGLLIGAGAQFNLSNKWSLHLEDYTSTGGNPNMFVFGGQYNF